MNLDEKDALEEEFEVEKRGIRIRWLIVTIIVALVVGVFSSEFSVLYYMNRMNKIKNSSTNAKENIGIISENLKNFRYIIDSTYLEADKIDEEKVMYETIKGYFRGLGDEYTEFFTPDEWKEFLQDALGDFVGIGIYMSTNEDGNVVVVTPIEGSPAEAVGIKAGDIIIKVNGESVLGQSTDEVSNKVKGEEGTEVQITVARDGEPIDFTIKRERIIAYHVKGEILEDNIGYIPIVSFSDGCAAEFEQEYLKLKEKGVKKIIIDLRSNTGGIASEATDIIDMFVPKGTVELITVDNKNNKDYTRAERDQIVSDDTEVVILINEYTASASEILAGSLKANGRVKALVGKKSYGKGVIQDVMELEDGSALKITSSEYYLPDETKIQKIGIEPDYEVEYDGTSGEDAQLNKAIEIIKQ